MRTLRCWLALSLSVWFGACGSGTTTGHPVTLETEIVADSAIDEGFETQTGWSVEIDTVALSLAALYYFDGEPAFAQREPSSVWQRLAALLGPSLAYAHPGHYVAGMARGEMIEPAALTLTSSPHALGVGQGLSGWLRSGRFAFAASAGDQPLLEGAAAYVRGRASKGEQTVHFVLTATLEEIAQNASEAQIGGAVFDEVEVRADGTVTVTVLPQVWLNLVHFDALDPGSAEEPTQVSASDDAQLAFAVGLAQRSAYHFSYRAER